jgi:quinol monooxygenase YgiN
MIHVIATIEVAKGKREEFLNEFRKVVHLVRAEAGCIAYGPTVDIPSGIGAQVPLREDVATIVEQWSDLTALQVHLTAPHMTEYRTRVKELVVKVQLQVLEPV